ncbi:MAG: hypothetical protein QOH63_1930 [Acidobacteriota bacterium]|jgi:hypothetical protein|nr:hypothetical protein [Acidobacteriota bacterium]
MTNIPQEHQGDGTVTIIKTDSQDGTTQEVDVHRFKDSVRPYYADPEKALSALMDGQTVPTPFAYFEIANHPVVPCKRGQQ